MGYYIHDIAGRLRVRTPLIKGNQTRAEELESLIKPISGVFSIETNTLTGSIVVNYDMQITGSGQILEALNRTGYFELSKAMTNDQYIRSAASKAGIVLSKHVAESFMEKAIAKSALTLLAALV